ncbi:MAG TPA: GNAT family N-acetyltransferase [Holophagaceae bacterium]|nr:GNAT family N-acetyltransferase [Geothrix sp.]HJW33161.1 GNAT family N-acetyltransferase [Holophagaceae bacterium]
MDLRWIAFGSPEYQEVVALRRRVLRIPLGLDFTPEQLAGEGKDLHLAAFEGGALVGCLMLSDHGEGVVQMRQVCVEPDRQGTGLGAALVRESEAEARRRGYRSMMLHARDIAVGFYERLGYARVGGPFVEVSIPHQEMAKAL